MPSAHTAVRYLRAASRTAFCVTSLATAANVTIARVALAKCAGLTTQAWSATSLQFVAGYLSDAWAIQAQHPTTAGSAVTGSSTFANKLDQAWISSYSGAKEESPVVLKPVLDTRLCAELAGPEKAGTTLTLATCSGSASQQFMGIGLIFNTNYTWSFLTTLDSTFCVQAAATGAASVRPIVLGPCVGNSRDTWMATVDLTTGTSGQYQEIYAANDPANSMEFSMAASGDGRAGSGIVLANDNQAAAQVWTDLAPGQATATGNADGSITLRPLSDESLCLTVPGADYAVGVQLTVQACNGAVDQEFVRGGLSNTIGLIAAGAGEFCVAAPAGMAAGSKVELDPCAQHDQFWATFFSWYGWAGVPPSPTEPVAEAFEWLVLSDASASGGTVAVTSNVGPANWDTSQDWTQVAVSGGFEIQSFYDPGLCLDAPDTTAGTQLTAAPCAGSSDQVFAFAAATGTGRLWELAATPATARMCVAVGSVSGTAGLPLVLQSCSAGATDEAWSGPSTQL